MPTVNRTIKASLHFLRRVYGTPVDLYVRGTIVNNYDTGISTIPLTKTKISKAIVFAKNLQRDVLYNSPYLAGSRDFAFGGSFDLENKVVIVERNNLPTAYVGSLNDHFIISGKMYKVKKVSEYSEGRAMIYEVELSKNERPLIIYDLIDSLIFGETYASYLG